MTDFIHIQWTTGSIEEARKVCRYLVQERLVACAQITPWVESVYMWDNELNTEQETRVLFKARQSQFEEIVSVIEQNTKYEVPEILFSRIEGGNASYLEWMQESLPEPAKA